MKRKTSKSVISRNEPILEKIRELKSEHPFWGYRRIWAYLNYHGKILINKKRVYKLMKDNKLLVTKQTRLRAKRTPIKAKPKAVKPNELWGIDMTKVKLASTGWAYIVLVVDWYSKRIVGSHVDIRSKTADWLKALDKGLQSQFQNGVRQNELKLISDNGCQPTSESFMKTCHHLDIKQIFTSYCNPKGNAETERMIRTVKEELLWLQEWNSTEQIEEALRSWTRGYNEGYLHSAHGYKPPIWAEKNYASQEAA